MPMTCLASWSPRAVPVFVCLFLLAQRCLPDPTQIDSAAHRKLVRRAAFALQSKNMSDCSAETMYYRTLGNTGMVTSVLGYGFWATFGVKTGLLDREGIETAKKIMTTARKGGINLFDNAEVYGDPRGEAERIFGQAYAECLQENPDLWRRSDVLITTKLFWGGDGKNEAGLSRKHIHEGMEASLKRLQLNYVDLVFCHRPDSITSTEMVVRAMTELVRNGKAMAWGTSEWSAQQITEAYWIARELGLEPPTIEQPQYHMFHRERFEKEYFPMFRQPYNMATTIWSPLAGGLLTGKYNDGVPEGSRVAQKGYEWLKSMLDEWKESGKLEKVKLLSDYANDKLDCSVSQLALAWCIKNKNVSTVLLGATKVEQMEDNLKSIQVAEKLTDENMKEIEEILGNKPDAYWGMFERKLPQV